jgi:hypothetical protein
MLCRADTLPTRKFLRSCGRLRSVDFKSTQGESLYSTMGRNLRNLLLPLLASYYMAPIHARFTKTTCWTGQNTPCIQQSAGGAWCYIPNVIPGLGATSCTGVGADFATVLEVHLAQGLSVAYYNGIGNSLLGGADYSIPSNPGVIRLCLSGQAGDGSYQTVCINALADNTFGAILQCVVIRGQNNVTDGCYSPNVVVHTPSSIISSPGSVSTSSPGSTNSGQPYTPAHASSAQSLNSMLHSVLLLCLPVILASFRMRVFGLFMLLVVASSWLPSTHARFTQTTCWTAQCIQQNSVGTWCYIPNSAPLRTTSCTSTNPANADMASVMEVHLSQGFSIAFYNGVDNALLGGANFSVPANPGIMRMCVSGQAGTGQLKTVCVNVLVDNAYESTDFCEVARGQQNVTDGCYNPNRAVKSPAPSMTLTTVVEGASSGVVYTPATTHDSHALSLNTFISNRWRFLIVLPTLVCLLGSRKP